MVTGDTMPTPQLLIGDYASLDGIKSRICNNRFRPLDTSMPTCRFRGTVVQAEGTGGTVTVIGWQRNVSRLQKIDISLPLIITVVLKKNPGGKTYYVDSVELDSCFKGSKGILCSTKYLDRNMKEAITGQVFDALLVKKTKLKTLHCFHLVEVLHGMISYFETVRDVLPLETASEIYFEEDGIDYLEGADKRSYCCGKQLVKGKEPVSYQLVLNDLFERTGFTKDGTITCDGPLSYEFSLQGRVVIRGSIANTGNNLVTVGFQKMLLECVKAMQTELGINKRETMYFTNLYPAAFMGLLTQMLAVRHFNSNYQYIMHAVTGLQRQNDTPLCIGSSVNMAEVKRYFPGFSADDLKG
jgi:hypothetical protein